ncbi:hypothetical protein FGB62_198g00 [Gracilaria domingensis]|nr:hypothetical protein FGB62_198g00 [Gracilaria domingensis]
MTNLLVRTIGKSRGDSRSFFLYPVSTVHEGYTADHDRRIAEKKISKWVVIEELVAMVTDNTESAKVARECFMNVNDGVLASQDEAHVADRLMVDIGDIE